MTLDEAIENTRIILPEHKEEFSILLKKFPENINEWLYGPVPEETSLYQGDMLTDMPVCFIDNDGDTVKGLDYIAMVSNTCDMQPDRKETVIASPIIVLSVFESHLKEIGDEGFENKINGIRNNNIFSYFYLPEHDKFPECFVDFSRMVTISSEFANNVYSKQRILSLSRYGFYLFLIKLTFHLARLEYTQNQN